MSLKAKLIKLAYQNPELRPDLLPLLKEARPVTYDDGSPIPESVLPLDASFVVPMSAGLDELHKVCKAFEARLEVVKSEYDGLPMVGTWVHDLSEKLAQVRYTLKRTVRMHMPAAKKALEAATAGSRLASASDWFLRYMKVFHPILTKIYRAFKGPVHPDPHKEFGKLIMAAQAMIDSSATMMNMMEKASSTAKFFFQTPETKKAASHIYVLYDDSVSINTQMHEIMHDLKGIQNILRKGNFFPESWSAM